jgi:hypothetical protein
MRHDAERLIREAAETAKFLSPEDRLGRLAREVGALRGHVVNLCGVANLLSNSTIDRDQRCHYVDAALGDIPVLLEVDWEKGDAGIYTLPNGDPGFPPTDASVSIIAAFIAGERVEDLEVNFSKSILERWTTHAIEVLEEAASDQDDWGNET